MIDYPDRGAAEIIALIIASHTPQAWLSRHALRVSRIPYSSTFVVGRIQRESSPASARITQPCVKLIEKL